MSVSFLVPLYELVGPMVCLLSHWMDQVYGFPSGSLIGMLQLRRNRLLLELFAGMGVPNTGGLFSVD